MKRNDETYSISFLNKDNSFREEKKEFLDWGNARGWGRNNLDNFNIDMIKVNFV